MNVVIGRVGITIKFKGFKRGNKSAIDTDMILFSTLSQMNPDYNFYFIGPSDFSKLTEEEYDEIFPKHNVFSAYDNSIRKTCEYDKVLEYFDENNIKIDFAIIATGGSSAVCIPNFYPRKDFMNELCDRVIAKGDKATTEDLTYPMFDRYKQNLYETMIEYGWSEYKAYEWCYGWKYAYKHFGMIGKDDGE
jgi:hypothetical protein